MKSKYYVLMLLAFMKCQTAISQGCNASPAGVMISHGHPKGSWMFSYTYMNMMMKNNRAGASAIEDPTVFQNYIMSPQNMRTDAHMLMGMYGLTGKFSMMVMVNYNVTAMEMLMFPVSMTMPGMGSMQANMCVHTSGFGDVKLYGMYKVLDGENASIVVNGGLNIPTSRTDLVGEANTMYEGQRLPYIMQSGAGSFDLLPGVTYLNSNRNITWSAQVSSVIRPFYNSIGYHYGNEVTLNAWASYHLIPHLSSSLRLEGTAAGAIKGNDPMVISVMEPDADPRNYGGQKANAYLGINYCFNNGILRDSKIAIEYGIPLYQYVNGIQLAARSSLCAGWSVMF